MTPVLDTIQSCAFHKLHLNQLELNSFICRSSSGFQGFHLVFKTVVLTFRCLSDSAPVYLSDLVELYKLTRDLRSENSRTIVSRPFRLANESFTCAAPSIWNALPLSVRSETDQQLFKSRLKTHLFSLDLLADNFGKLGVYTQKLH